MATLLELLKASGDDTFRQKIRVACVLSAEKIRNEDPGTVNHTQRMAWARRAFTDPEDVGNPMVNPVLAQNSTFTLAQIIGATDAAVQDAVDKAVNVFAV